VIPTQIGPFEIVAPMASTGGGLIYRAKEPKVGRSVVIRVMPDMGEARVQRFRQEAKAASVLDNPNIVSFLGGGECDDGFFVVMEYVEGTSLRALLKENRQPQYEVLDLCRQACIALDHAAAHGIVHPNLTPANVMVDWDGSLKILDFAIPKDEEPSAGSSARQFERLHYASPEQVSGETLDRGSNLYSWGAILYEMVAGKPPFAAETADALCRQILEDCPAPPHQFNTAWSAGVSSVILKALSKAREERYASGAEFIRELESHQKKPVHLWPPIEAAECAAAPIVRGTAAVAVNPLSDGAGRTAVLEMPAQQATETSLASPRQVAAALFRPPTQFGDAPAAEAYAADAIAKEKTSDNGHQPKTLVHEETVRIVSIPAKVKTSPTWNLTTRVAALALLVVSLSLAGGLYWRHRSSSSAEPVATPVPIAEQGPATAAEPDVSMTAIVPNIPVRKRPHRAAVAVALPAPVVTTGDVVVNSTPLGAEFQIDGRSDRSWVTPTTISGLSSGQHTFVLTKAGYVQQSHTIQVPAGNKAILAVTFAEVPAILTVASEPPGAVIIVDGKDSGRTTPSQFAVVKGVHVVALSKPGFFDATTTAEVNAGQNFRFSPTLKQMGNAESIKSAGRLKKLFGAAPKDMAAVQIKTQPKGARVTVNNRLLEKVTPLEFFLEPGNYEIAITAEGHKPKHRSVTLERDSKLVIDESLEK
jgi:hypothetical protein